MTQYSHSQWSMGRSIFSWIILLIFVSNVAEAGTRCFSVKGKLVCQRNSTRHADTEIYLMDDDGPLNPDDTMGWTTTDLDGTFKIEGCGYDFLSDPDPYLKILNTCNSDKVIKTRVDLPYKFAPEIIDAGEIHLDLK